MTGQKLMSDSENLKIDELTIRVRLEKNTMELFTIPLPPCPQKYVFKDPTRVRVLDNPLEDSLRNYIVWRRL